MKIVSQLLRKVTLVLLCGGLTTLYGFSKTQNLDSLRTAIGNEKIDSVKVDRLISLASDYYGLDLELANECAQEALDLATNIGYTNGMAYAHKSIGIVHYFKSESVQAIDEWNKARQIFEQIPDTQGVANMFSNMGAVYLDQGSYHTAMEYLMQAMKLAELVKDSVRLATTLQNIAAIAQDLKEVDNALTTFARAQSIFESLKNYQGAGLVMVNMANLEMEKFRYDTAMSLFVKASRYLDGTNYKGSALLGIGQVYQEKGELDVCLKYYDSAYHITKAFNPGRELARINKVMAVVYQEKKDYPKAIELFNEAIDILNSDSTLSPTLSEAYGGLVSIYRTLNDYEKAFYYQTKKEEVKDKIYDAEAKKKFERLMFEHELGNKEIEIEVLTKDKELQDYRLSRQRFIRNILVAGFIVLLIFAASFYTQRNKISKERKKSDALLLNILPAEIADELKEKGHADARDYHQVSILFTDFKQFTLISEKLSAKELVSELNHCFKAFDTICEKYGIEKIKTLGDSYMAAGGLPVPNADSPHKLVLAALEMSEFVSERRVEREGQGLVAFEMRAGIHTGNVVAGIVGVKKFQYDVWGDTVNTASRMESHGEVGKVNISRATYELVKGDPQFKLEHRGKIDAKGKGEIDMYFVHRA